MNTATIITDKFVFGGKCIGKIDGKTVFVPYAIPGEELEIEITESKKDFDEAVIKNIVKPSPFRIKASCPLYEKCGGCNMMHIKEEEQLSLKIQMMKDLFEKNGVKLPEITALSGKNQGYRSRFNLNDGCLTGRKTNDRIPVTECLVADKNINEWFKNTPSEYRPKGRCNIFGSDLLDKKLIVADTNKKADGANFIGAKKKNKNIKAPKKFYSGTSSNEQTEGTVNLLGKNISFDVRGFFQSNMEVLEKAVKETISGLKGTKALDMYAGCGTFSVFLADFFEEVTLVEHNRDALVFAEKNLAGKNHVSWGMSGEKWVNDTTSKKPDFDAVVIDPPRSGMEKDVLEWLSKSGIPQIRALSCDPATQSRDIAYLIKNGYKIEKAFLLDFYPNTSHIESLISLVKE